MIPQKLQIKNFLSYGEQIQTIDFGDYPLICLSGKNGHGKSALLDAITWTIWGQARKISGTTKADQGLLKLGQTQMMTCLDFVCAGQFYRIKREFMQTYGKPVTILDFGLLDRSNDRFISLTEKTIRDTQAKIDQVLHLNFDAFINSAFLRQGHANEFSKKTPKERKEILASILGLDRYETIRKLANERIKESMTHKTHLSMLNTKLEQELALAPLIAQKLLELKNTFNDLCKQEQLLFEHKKKWEQENFALQEDQQKFGMVQYQIQQLTEEKNNQEQTLKELLLQWKTIHKQQLTKIDYNLLDQQKKEHSETIKVQQELFQTQLILKQRLLEQKEINTTLVQEFNEQKSNQINTKKIAIERLIAEKKHIETVIKELEASITHLNQEIQKIQSEQTKCLSQKKIIPILDKQIIEKQFEKRKEHYQKWITQANIIKTELVTLEQKNKLVHHEESPSCPLCEQNLSASRKRFLKNKFDDLKYFLEGRFSRLSILIKKLKIILIEQHTVLETLKKQQQEQEILFIKNEEVSKTLNKYQIEKVDTQAHYNKYLELRTIITNTIHAEQESLKQLLENNKQELEDTLRYKKNRETIKEIEKQIESSGFNQMLYETALKQAAHIEKQLTAITQLQNQHLLQTQRADQIHKLCIHLKNNKKQLKDLSTQSQIHIQIIEKQKKLESQKQEIEQSFQKLTHNKESLLEQKGSLENEQHKVEQLKKDYDQQKKELILKSGIIDDYQAIAQATSKDGIQALLIEDTIPEIEHEANELLSKLTDNQTQLFIESLRDLKKGGTKETLDIKISDAAGIRQYELFSGGEAFRIDFALRIAISKLLARRAGTSLQTLIIDEGFGSQDEEGLAHIMDALYKIQDDFAKIIIVSHLSSMKNQFPVHFVIEKGPNGSTVEIIEQG